MRAQIKSLKKSVHGHYQAVADKAGVSKATVSNVLSGKYINEAVLLAAIEVRSEIQQKLDKTRKKVEEALK